MLTELSPNESLAAVMSGAAATTNPHAFTMWSQGASNHTYLALNGTTAVTLVAAPGGSTQRLVESVRFYNDDTAAVTITLSKVIDGTSRTIEKFILGVGFSATVDGTGVHIVDSYGGVPTSQSTSGIVIQGVKFIEDSSATSYTATVEIAAGTLVHDIGFTTTVLWNGTSASLDIGDDDDPNGWFAAVNVKATDLVVGEVLSAADDGTWGGKNGVYLTAAGRRGRITAGVDSGWYYGAASEVIFLVTPGAADGTAGRSFGWVKYSIPSFALSTNV